MFEQRLQLVRTAQLEQPPIEVALRSRIVIAAAMTQAQREPCAPFTCAMDRATRATPNGVSGALSDLPDSGLRVRQLGRTGVPDVRRRARTGRLFVAGDPEGGGEHDEVRDQGEDEGGGGHQAELAQRRERRGREAEEADRVDQGREEDRAAGDAERVAEAGLERGRR